MNDSIAEVKSLRERSDDYISFKRASGTKASKEAQVLHRFITLVEQWEPGACTVTKESAERWATLSPEETAMNQQHRKGVVQRFARYLIFHGVEAFLYPKYKYAASNFKPYIFTNEELARFFTACDNTLTPNLIRSDVAALIFRLLYASGMRVSEAIRLRVRDVDLEQGIIRINEAKFDKERLLPVHDELLMRMKKYSKKVLTFSGQDGPFFPNVQKEHYSQCGIYCMFRERLWAAGISHGGKGNGPRVHDFRHTFAVHCLRRAILNGDDLSVTMKYLSVYMGHSNVFSTQAYLRLTSDMYPDIVCKMEKTFDVLPNLEVLNETY
jgi:integrase